MRHAGRYGAGLLAKRLRESDIVARIGGDEFAILLPHGDREAATTLAMYDAKEAGRDR